MEKHRQKGAERMTEKMEGRNPLVQLIRKFQKGTRLVTLGTLSASGPPQGKGVAVQ
jgi:hypothetical protein